MALPHSGRRCAIHLELTLSQLSVVCAYLGASPCLAHARGIHNAPAHAHGSHGALPAGNPCFSSVYHPTHTTRTDTATLQRACVRAQLPPLPSDRALAKRMHATRLMPAGVADRVRCLRCGHDAMQLPPLRVHDAPSPGEPPPPTPPPRNPPTHPHMSHDIIPSQGQCRSQGLAFHHARACCGCFLVGLLRLHLGVACGRTAPRTARTCRDRSAAACPQPAACICICMCWPRTHRDG